MKRLLALALLLALATPALAQLPDCAAWTHAMSTTTEADELVLPPGSPPYIACAEARWGVDYAKRGFLHHGDHEYALRRVLGREPSRLEIGDSWVAGDYYPTLAYLMAPDNGSLSYCLISTFNSMSRGTREWECIISTGRMCRDKPVTACADRVPTTTPPPPPPPPVEPPPVDPPDPPALCWVCPAYVPVTAPPRVVETAEDASGWKVIGPGRANRLREWLAWTMEVLAEMYQPAPATYTRPAIISCLDDPAMPGTCEARP